MVGSCSGGVGGGGGGGGEKRVLTLEWHCGIAPPTFSANNFPSEMCVPRKFVSSAGNKFPSCRATFDVCSACLRAFQFSSRSLVSPIATISFMSETKTRGCQSRAKRAEGAGEREESVGRKRERERETDGQNRKKERKAERDGAGK